MKSYRRKKMVMSIILSLVGILFFITMLFPLYWMIITSFKFESDVFLNPPQIIPSRLTLEAYIAQLTSPVIDI